MNKAFEKILERFEDLREGLLTTNTEYNSNLIDAMMRAGQIVHEVASEYNNGWIPVSEKMPERNKVVLCWVRSTTIASGETYIIGSCDNGFWFLQTYEIGHHHFPVKDYEVVAWQPLPESYKES